MATANQRHAAAVKWLTGRREALSLEVLNAVVDEDGEPTGMPTGEQVKDWTERLAHQQRLEALLTEFKPKRAPRSPKKDEEA